jgi:hypothetical protein
MASNGSWLEASRGRIRCTALPCSNHRRDCAFGGQFQWPSNCPGPTFGYPLSNYKVVAFQGRDGKPIAIAIPLANANTIAIADSGRISSATSTPAATGTEHVRRPGESVGLQLLRGKPDLQPAQQLLRLLQLHSQLLEIHQRIRRSVQRRNLQSLRW